MFKPTPDQAHHLELTPFRSKVLDAALGFLITCHQASCTVVVADEDQPAPHARCLLLSMWHTWLANTVEMGFLYVMGQLLQAGSTFYSSTQHLIRWWS